MSSVESDIFSFFDSDTPRHIQLTGAYRKSIAYFELKDNLPVILTKVINTLTQEKDELVEKYGVGAKNDVKRVIARLSKIKYELQTNKNLLKLEISAPDKRMWNNYLEKLRPHKKTFFGAHWLDAECYVYRRMKDFFADTNTLKDYDAFRKRKMEMCETASLFFSVLLNIVPNLEKKPDSLESLFKVCVYSRKLERQYENLNRQEVTEEMIQVALNEFFGKQEEPQHCIDPMQPIHKPPKKKLFFCNDSKQAYTCLEEANEKEVVVHFILNEIGLELFIIFVIADFLLTHKLATHIEFHPKAYPFFVGDATYKDIDWFLRYLINSKEEIVSSYGSIWKGYFKEKVFRLPSSVEYFWTTPHPYYKMRDISPKLYKHLKSGHLLIFIGDLNYRKLLGDYCWDEGEEFITCLRGFLPTNLLALRAIRTTVLCGVDKIEAFKLSKTNSTWMTSGEYAVIQFCRGERCDCEDPQDYLPDDDYFDIYASESESCSEILARYRAQAEEEGYEIECEEEQDFVEEETEHQSPETKPKPKPCFDEKKKKIRVMKCRKIFLKYRVMEGVQNVSCLN